MGSTFAADQKLMFYPTDVWETKRMMAILAICERGYAAPSIKRVLSETDYGNVSELSVSRYSRDKWGYEEVTAFDYLLNKQDFITLNKCQFNFHLSGNYINNEFVTILDPFCGEGDWLNIFKLTINKDDKFKLIGNEIEENRYKIAKKKVDICYNLAFEDFSFPKNSISLLLYNPPYGSTNGIRNAKYYLEMILNREYLIRSNDNEKYPSLVVMVLRKDDYRDCADIITRNFEPVTCYKVNQKEYEKYKQVIYIGKLRKEPLIDSNWSNLQNYTNDRHFLLSALDADREFEFADYYSIGNYNRNYYYPVININDKLVDFEFSKIDRIYISEIDQSWKWVMEKTLITPSEDLSITMPKTPTIPEIANLMAAGGINGNIANHIAVGGTTTVKDEVVTKEKNDKDEEVQITTTIIRSKPYLYVLYTEDGCLKIKNLGGENNDPLLEEYYQK